MDKLQELRRRHTAAEQGGGEDRQNRQHKEGKLSARERIELLLDEGTFEELYMFVTGPDVIRTVTHEDVTKERLGGSMTHNSVSGVGHFIAPNDGECLRMIRELLGYLPQNNRDDPPRRPSTDPADRMDAALDTLVPPESNQPYDIKDAIHRVVDDGEFFEVHEHFARNIVVGFARLDGRSVGIVANQPA